jgi:glyoxylase-like metal-dependent hydrolase (beta-lactamase superfamily II)
MCLDKVWCAAGRATDRNPTKVAPYEEIGARLHDMQIDPRRDISGVILTHLHHDHTGGLDHFPHTPIIGRARAGMHTAAFAV